MGESNSWGKFLGLSTIAATVLVAACLSGCCCPSVPNVDGPWDFRALVVDAYHFKHADKPKCPNKIRYCKGVININQKGRKLEGTSTEFSCGKHPLELRCYGKIDENGFMEMYGESNVVGGDPNRMRVFPMLGSYNEQKDMMHWYSTARGDPPMEEHCPYCGILDRHGNIVVEKEEDRVRICGVRTTSINLERAALWPPLRP